MVLLSCSHLEFSLYNKQGKKYLVTRVEKTSSWAAGGSTFNNTICCVFFYQLPKNYLLTTMLLYLYCLPSFLVLVARRPEQTGPSWLYSHSTAGPLSKEAQSRVCAVSTCKMRPGMHQDFRNRTPRRNCLFEMSSITWSYYNVVY